MKKFSVMARPYGSDREIEICQCDSNPEALVEGAQNKSMRIATGNKKISVGRYDHVYFKENSSS